METILEIYSFEKTTLDGNKKYNVYNTKTATGKFVETRFTNNAGYPKLKGHFKIKCKASPSQCKKTGRPIIWVNEIIEEISIENKSADILNDILNS